MDGSGIRDKREIVVVGVGVEESVEVDGIGVDGVVGIEIEREDEVVVDGTSEIVGLDGVGVEDKVIVDD